MRYTVTLLQVPGGCTSPPVSIDTGVPVEIIYKCRHAEPSTPIHCPVQTLSLTLLFIFLLPSFGPFYSFSFRHIAGMAAKLLSLYLLAVVGLGVVNAGTPSPMATSSNEALTTSRAAPLELRQSNQTCVASQNKMASDLKQMSGMLNQLSMQMHGFV
jgi:hypothetical protein